MGLVNNMFTIIFGLLMLAFSAGADSGHGSDFLYIGDGNDDTVKRFDATTGEYLGMFVATGSGGINGPRGMIFSHGSLYLANQNVDQSFAGEILRYNGSSGAFMDALVPCNPPLTRPCAPNGPFAPRGLIRGSGRTLYVADHDARRVAQYGIDSGEFLGILDNSGFSPRFFPRGIETGPDDLLYVSVTALPEGDVLAGYVLRFDPRTGRYVDTFTSHQGAGCAAHLHRPEGLVFGPDNRLYVTSFRADDKDIDRILIFNGKTGRCIGEIELDKVGEPRAFAQALLFGPGKRLFVPINNTGEVRRYNVRTKAYDSFLAAGGELVQPWFLTFGATDPRTLEYHQ